jgi:hypothetical protein
MNPHPRAHDYFGSITKSDAGVQTNQIKPQPSTAYFEAHSGSPTLASQDREIPSLPTIKSRLATPNHIWIPGAPPASKPLLSPSASIQPSTLIVPQIHTIPPTPAGAFEFDEIEDVPQLLPDASWIAIVCGVSKAQWSSQRDGQDSELPAGFFVAPRDVYMPDLTAVGDVLLGKLVRRGLVLWVL